MMKFLNKKRKVLGNKGFSLVELIIVIAIMAVLMAVLAPQLIKYVEKSRVQADDTFMSELKNAVQLACSDDTIYSGLATSGDQIVWDPSSTDGLITVTITDAVAKTAMTTAILETIGTETEDGTSITHKATSKTYQNATTSEYIIAISIDDGVVTFDETLPE